MSIGVFCDSYPLYNVIEICEFSFYSIFNNTRILIEKKLKSHY